MNSPAFDRLEAARIAPEYFAVTILKDHPDAKAAQEQAAYIQVLLKLKSAALKETDEDYHSDEARGQVLLDDLKKPFKTFDLECRYGRLSRFFKKTDIENAKLSVSSPANIKDPAVPPYAIILSQLLDNDLTQGVQRFQLGLRIANLLDDQSLDYPREAGDDVGFTSLSDARASLNELLDKRHTGAFPTTQEQRKPFHEASMAMMDDGIDLMKNKYPEAAENLRDFIKPEIPVVQKDLTRPQTLSLWRKTANFVTARASGLVKQAPQLVVGIAAGAGFRLLFSAAAIAVTGPSLAVPFVAGALAGGCVGVWRASRTLSAEEKAKGYMVKAFAFGAAFGFVGGSIGVGLGSVVAGLVESSTTVVSNATDIISVVSPEATTETIKAVSAAPEVPVVPAPPSVSAALASSELPWAETEKLLNSSPNTRCGVNGWSPGVLKTAVKERLSGWWGGVFLNHGVPAGVDVTRSGVHEQIFFKGGWRALASVLGGPR